MTDPFDLRDSRRRFLAQIAGAVAWTPALLTSDVATAAIPRRDPDAKMTLGIGNYGMQALKVEEAISLIAETGFDSLELSLMPDWDSAPSKFSEARRRTVRKQLEDTGLRLTSLMEDLHPSSDEAVHRQGIERLKLAIELGHTLSSARPPLIQTVLGGGKWFEKRDLFVKRLTDWKELAETTKTVIAIKPHRSGAMSLPEDALWLRKELGDSEWLGMVYDYSHYADRQLPLEESIEAAAPATALVAVKDIQHNGMEYEFVLPGEAGTVNYTRLLKRFITAEYTGDVCCEVSSQVFRKPGYDPVEAARKCYRNMAKAFTLAGMPRKVPRAP
ncbi:MAG: TIM barrel protein [Planctomycetota bacterium]|nr:TIM barrel protein [Planctomycetota bacterium]